jgi:hypothetical protein
MEQHGTVLSEVLLEPGPTDSVFDLLACACRLHPNPLQIALLGFAGGSVLAALRALGIRAQVQGIDLDRQGYDRLRQGRPGWLQPLCWRKTDAIAWLARTRRRFDVIVEDLSVPCGGDVEKPESTWEIVPRLMAGRLAPGGLAVFNLLRPPGMGWSRGIADIQKPFAHAVRADLFDYHNRVLIASQEPFEPGRSGEVLRQAMRDLGSTQASRFRVRQLA